MAAQWEHMSISLKYGDPHEELTAQKRVVIPPDLTSTQLHTLLDRVMEAAQAAANGFKPE